MTSEVAPAVEPFSVAVDEAVLDDLRARLARAQLAPVLGDDDPTFGITVAQLTRVIEHWRDAYDWRAREAEINAYTHVRTTIDGQPVHALHERGDGTNPLPIVLTHGWPWTFWDFRRLIDLLAHPERHGGDAADAFDVVVPSLPGFVFSTPLAGRGTTFARTADLWVELMARLGYERFAAHGGDMGAFVTGELGHRHPEHVVGAHLSTVVRLGAWNLERPWSDLVRTPLPDDPQARAGVLARERKYAAHITVQVLEPQTVAHALHDSPVGLASWVLQRRRAWSDCGGDLETRFTLDELVTHIMLWWATGTYASSARFYHTMANTPWTPAREGLPVVSAPTGFTLFTRDLLPGFDIHRLSDEFNIVHVTESDVGGHFGAAEEPEVVAASLREMFRPLRGTVGA